MTIEEKELKGVTIKNLYWLLGSIGSIIFTVLITYFSIISRIEKIEILKTETEKYNDLRISILESKINSFDAQFKGISDKYETIIIELKKINK